MWLEKQSLKEYELETMLMGEDDDMEKKAVYLGTLEWSENSLGVRPDRRHVHSLFREFGMENLSKYPHATLCHCGRRKEIGVTVWW